MHLVRILLLCLATVAIAAQPSRAAPACPMQAVNVGASAQLTGDHRRGEQRTCPDRMACCAPMAVRATAQLPLVPLMSRAEPQGHPATDRDREDATRLPLLRPPRSI